MSSFQQEERSMREKSVSVKNQHKSSPKCLICTKFLVSASIPVLITIFTIVTYIQQKEIAEVNRRQHLQIANKTRLNDQLIPEKQRQEEQCLANDLHYQTVYNIYIEDIATLAKILIKRVRLASMSAQITRTSTRIILCV
jgi:hypothetical protein